MASFFKAGHKFEKNVRGNSNLTKISADKKYQNVLAKLKLSFARGGFANNVTTLLVGNISGQAIAFVAAPFITRIYGPDDFGSMTLVWSYVGILSVISCLRYESTIVIEKENSEAYNIFLLCIIISSCSTLLLTGSIFLFGKHLANIIGLKASDNLLWFIPLGVFAVGMNNVFSYWYTRSKSFILLSFCRINLALLTAGTKITLGLIFFSSGVWLLAGNILGFIGVISIQAGFFLIRDLSLYKSKFSWEIIKNVAKKYSNFPRYFSFTSLLNSFSQNLPVLLFALFFSPQVVGFYGLANTLLRRPIGLMAESLSNVFLQKASHSLVQGKSLKQDLLKTSMGLAIIGILPFIVILIWGRNIFSLVFGNEWSTAGFYAQILSPWLFMLFINPPFTQILIAKQKLKFILFFDVANICLRVLVIVISYYLFSSPIITLVFFSGAGMLANLYYMKISYHHSGE